MAKSRKVDFVGALSNVNLRELAIRFPHVVVSGNMVYCFQSRPEKEFEWYFRSVKSKSSSAIYEYYVGTFATPEEYAVE